MRARATLTCSMIPAIDVNGVERKPFDKQSLGIVGIVPLSGVKAVGVLFDCFFFFLFALLLVMLLVVVRFFVLL